MPLIPLNCPSCGGKLTVDSDKDAAICEFCGNPYIVKDAIVKNYITNVTNIKADTVNIYTTVAETKDYYNIRAGELIAYTGPALDIIIPDSVKVIGSSVFIRKSITSVVIPDGVYKISRNAFWGCKNITEVKIPDSVKNIEPGAFDECSGINTVRLSAGLISQNSVFKNCKNIKKIIIGEQMTPQTLCIWFDIMPMSIKEIDFEGPQNIDEIVAEAQSELWKYHGLCSYCGGNFHGFGKKKCDCCGKQKNY